MNIKGLNTLRRAAFLELWRPDVSEDDIAKVRTIIDKFIGATRGRTLRFGRERILKACHG